MNSKKISIIIPVYNGANYLRDAIDSALGQTYDNCEVIVVNDGSSDDGATEAIAQGYGEQIRYFYKENGGVASALNLAICKMQGDYFAWCSHDDMFEKDKCEKQMRALDENGDDKRIVIGAYKTLNVDDNDRIETSEKISDCMKERLNQNGVAAVLAGIVHGCTVLIHKSHFERCGVFDENLKTTQDYDLWFRMFRGQKLIYMEEPLVISRKHSEQGSRTIASHYKECNEICIKFTDLITAREINELFDSPYKFYWEMFSFADKRGFQSLAKYVKEKLVLTEEPDDLEVKIREQMQEFKKIGLDNENKIYIFGAGKNGTGLYTQLITRGIHIEGFIDNAEEKWNQTLKGIRIESLESVVKYTGNKKIIISINSPEILIEQLEKENITNYLTKRELDDYLAIAPPFKAALALLEGD